MNPLKLKASGTPITSSNFQGLQTMTDAEIQNYIAYVITNKFSADTNGSGTAELNVDTANALTGTSIGTFTDTARTEATGTHPATGATTSTTYYAKQVTASASGSVTNRAVGYSSGVSQLTDTQINTDVLDKVISAMVTESSYTTGQYKLQPSAPTGGTWTSRYTITDVANGGNATTYLWQKTTATSSGNADLRPLKTSTNSLQAMTDAEIQQMVPAFRNRIISTGVGTYLLQASAPAVAGTWVQMGSAFSDTREQVVSQNYTGSYSGSYTGGYTGTYSAAYTGGYSGTYTGNYVGPQAYSGNYTGSYTGNYTGTYAGTGPYSGTYSTAFAGTYMGPGYATAYVGYYSLFYGGFAGTAYTGYYTSYFSAAYTGYYTGNFTGYYTGPKNYSGTYSGAYSGTYTGYYTGTGTYTGYYSGTYTGYYTGYYSGTYTGYYSGTYSGTYAGNTVISTKDTVSSVTLWVRTA